MVFRNSSSSKRSARESWRTTRICASVIGGSSGSSGSGSATGAGTAAAGRSPRLERRGPWEGLRAWALACSWNQEVCHGAWGRAGRALARAGQEPAQELAQSLQRQQPPPLSGSSLPSLSSKHLLPRARPTNPSAVEVYAEADAGAAEVHHVALVVRELEAEVAQSNGASVGVGFHDVSHTLLADDLGNYIVAQRADGVRGVGQAAAAEIQLVVGVHLHEGEDLAAALHPSFPTGG